MKLGRWISNRERLGWLSRERHLVAAGPLVIRALPVVGLIVLWTLVTPGQPRRSNGKTLPPRPAHATDTGTGVISGTALDNHGRAVVNTTVLLFGADDGQRSGAALTVATQPDGSFRFTGLRPGSFALSIWSPGYVRQDLDEWPGHRKRYRNGANVALTLVKGGVITGTIADQAGNPAGALRVRAIRIRDSTGRRLIPTDHGVSANTDERGRYRLYGLPGGSYLVVTGAPVGNAFNLSQEADISPGATYFHSADAELETEVAVKLGTEVNGIDIRLREGRGHSITGTITGAHEPPAGIGYGIDLTLRRASNGLVEGEIFVQPRNGEYAFAFTGLADGDYYLQAKRSVWSDISASPRSPVTVKGADVTGLNLTLVPYASVGGRIVFDPRPSTINSPCGQAPAPALVQEFIVDLRHTGNSELERNLDQREGAPEADGTFLIERVLLGSYWPQLEFPNDRQYVRSIVQSGRSAKAITTFGRDGNVGLTLGAGQNFTGLTITMADGAAGLQGRLASPNRESEPASTPSALTAPVVVHLVPAEPGTSDDLPRYREVEVGADGSFALANLAPGKYWIYGEQLRVAATSASDGRSTVRTPAAWDAAARLKLRRAAEAANVALELTPCQRITDYAFRFAPAK